MVHLHKYNPAENAESDFVAEIANVVQKKDLGWSDARAFSKNDKRANTILVRDRIHKFHRLESTLRPPENRHVALQQNKPSVGNWEKEQTGGRFGVFFYIYISVSSTVLHIVQGEEETLTDVFGAEF